MCGALPVEMFIIGLTGHTKQAAAMPDAYLGQAVLYLKDHLVPDFFLMSMLSSLSATSTILL
jgi:hypothetical protein